MTYKQLTAKLRAISMGNICDTAKVRVILQASRRKERDLVEKSDELAEARHDAQTAVGTAYAGELGAID